VRIFGANEFASSAARHIAERLRSARSAVITGGSTARRIYTELRRFEGIPNLEIAFSDERSVPPDHDASNYGMARRTLLDPLGLTNIHRIYGEDDPVEAAAAYEEDVRDLVESGFDLVLLGLGDDAHIAALFPGAGAVSEKTRLCVPVERPDGMRGITLTLPALLSGKEIIVAADGGGKAGAVRRAIRGDEPPDAAPVQGLAAADRVTFLLDEGAGGLLS
jgi:6-phosphogluconolactonase